MQVVTINPYLARVGFPFPDSFPAALMFRRRRCGCGRTGEYVQTRRLCGAPTSTGQLCDTCWWVPSKRREQDAYQQVALKSNSMQITVVEACVGDWPVGLTCTF
jgi:hypothetical protein